MAAVQALLLAAVLLSVPSGLHCSSVLTGCPELCTCQSSSLVNCSSSGLSLAPRHIHDSVTDLDLSHNLFDSVTLNQPHLNLKNVWLGNNSITRLSLCMERYLGTHTRYIHRLRPRSRQGCVSWAPTLQLLSVERNQLDQLPEGLEGSESLHVLQLSYNKISSLRPGDLSHLPQLIELHLQHNLITSLHPQTFQDLLKLQVLDLSFNKLTSLHPVMYHSLRNILSGVRLAGNRWQCDCTMHSLRRWMIYDSSRGQQTWSVFCASPSILSGRDLLHLKEDDLKCLSTDNRQELHQDLTVYSGSEILLSCSGQGSMWTPTGKAALKQPQAGLLITDITERDAGLYVCVSEAHEVVSVFNLQISKVENARRITRSLSRSSQQIILQGTPNTSRQQKRNQRASQSDLALAVCLSVFFTFLVAFILGILARPCIDVLWRRVTNKKKSSVADPVSSVEQRQYDNEAYSNGEEPEVIGIHRERRVTFSTVDIRETNNVQYYDTVASGEQESINNDVVIECEAAKAEMDTYTAGDSGSEKSVRPRQPEKTQQDVSNPPRVTDVGCQQKIEFEHISDSIEPERRRRLSTQSDSSLYDKVCNEDQMTQTDHAKPKPAQIAEDLFQQRADFRTETEMAQISTDGSEIPGFSSEPFSDWLPHTKNSNLTDNSWKDNDEQFEFSDSFQSTSARSSSVCGLTNPKLPVLSASDKHKGDDTSSSSSCISEGEPTEYIVNYNKEEKHIKSKDSDDGFQKQIYGEDSIIPSVCSNHPVKTKDSFSSHTSDSDCEDTIVKQQIDKGKGKDESVCVSDMLTSSSIATGECDTRKDVNPTPRSKWRVLSLSVLKAPSTPATYSSSSSSESEVEVEDLKEAPNMDRLNEGIKINEQGILSSDLDRQRILQIKKHLIVNAPVAASDSSSSEESMDEPRNQTKSKEQEKIVMDVLPVQGFEFAKNNNKPQWPSQVIKAPSSSSSGSEDEMTHDAVRQRPVKVDVAGLPFQDSQAETEVLQNKSCNLEKRWPEIDLKHSAHIKKRLDIKPPLQVSQSSSSSDSEDETPNQIKKKEQSQTYVPGNSIEVSQLVSRDPHTQWPELDLKNTKRIKKRLDIKSSTPNSDSSSSSDGEDATSQQDKQRPVQVGVVRLPFQETLRESRHSDKTWPELDLKHCVRIKKRLDIKPSSLDYDSSSSSDSEDETNRQDKQRPIQVDIVGPFQETQRERHGSDKRWPEIGLGNATLPKEHVDIKPPSHGSDSSSSTDSEDEVTSHPMKHRPGKEKTDIPETKFPFTKCHDQDIQWPELDLKKSIRIKKRLDIKTSLSHSSSSSDSEGETPNQIKTQEQSETYIPGHSTGIKKHLDIKPSSPDADSSSSSDSEDETRRDKQRPVQVGIVGLPFQETLRGSRDSDKIWPELDLKHSVRIKKRLDIKLSSPHADSSSSSDTEDETPNQIKKQEQSETYIPGNSSKVSQILGRDPQTQWPQIDLKNSTGIKKRLDIKPSSPDSDSSSSSDSVYETSQQDKQRPVQVGIMGFPLQETLRERHGPDKRWPELGLGNATFTKGHVDIKPPSHGSDLSSSTDSEDEVTSHPMKHRPGKEKTDIPETKFPFTKCHDQDIQWPELDLKNRTRIKKRLDIKTSLSHSSSSRDSEGETPIQIKKQEQSKTYMPRHPSKVSQIVSHDPQTQWPELDLEHTTSIKRHLDIKSPSPGSNSSSSSDSEDGTTQHTEKRPEGMGLEQFTVQKSQKAIHDRDTRWPALDLGSFIHIKKRLDFRAAVPLTTAECMEDLHITPTTVDSDPDSRWPTLDLSNVLHVRRRLDVRTRENECVTTEQTEKKTARTDMDITSSPLGTKLPNLNLSIPFIKRRMNIKTPLQPVDSSNGVSESRFSGHTVKHEISQVVVGIENHDKQMKINEENIYVKRGLDIKAPQPDPPLGNVAPGTQSVSNSSTSDSEDETQGHATTGLGESATSRNTEKALIGSPKNPAIRNYYSPKRDHNIKLEKYIAIADDMGDRTTDNISPDINPELESRWASMNLGISRFRKRLEISSPTREMPDLPSTPPPGSPFSPSTDKITGSAGSRTRQKRKDLGMEGILLTKSSPKAEYEPGNVSLSLKGTIIVQSDSLCKTEKKTNPETIVTGFAMPHLRKYLDIKVSEKTVATQPEQQLHVSSSSSENEEAPAEYVDRRLKGRTESQTMEEGRMAGVDLKSQTLKGREESKQVKPNLSHTHIPKIKRTVDIGASLQKESSSSESSEEETNDHSSLTPNVPHVQRSQNVKAPLTEQSDSSSSSSESGNEVAECPAKQSKSVKSEMTVKDLSTTYYKRSIFQSSLPSSRSFSHTDPIVDHTKRRHEGTDTATVADKSPSLGVGLSDYSLPSMRFDDVVRRRIEESKRTLDTDMLSGSRLTGIAHQSTDLISSTSKHPHVNLSTPQQDPPVQPPAYSMYSRRESEYQISHDRGRTDGTLIHTHSSFIDSSGPLASSRAIAKRENIPSRTNEILRAAPTDRTVRKGLNALKVMSSERQKWDLQAEYVDKGKSPLFDDHGQKVESSFSYPRTEGIKSVSTQPQRELHLPSISADSRSTELFYNIPLYRKHDFGGTELTQEPRPPLSAAAPPPDGSVARSLTERHEKQGSEATTLYLQHKGSVVQSDLSSNVSENLEDYFDYSNMISHV